MSSPDPDDPDDVQPRVYNTRNRPKLMLVSASNTSFLEQLVTDGLNSDVPTSSVLSDSEEELCDFSGSEIADPDYEPDVDNSSSDESQDGDENFINGRYFGGHSSDTPSGGGDAHRRGGDTLGDDAPGGGGDGPGGDGDGPGGGGDDTPGGDGDGPGGGGDGPGGGGDDTPGGDGDGPGGGGDGPGGGGDGPGGGGVDPPGGDGDGPGGDGDGPGGGGDGPGGGGGTSGNPGGITPEGQYDLSVFGCSWVEDDVPLALPETVYFDEYPDEAKINIHFENPTPSDVYCHFIDEELWEFMAQETNRFAIQFLTGNEPSVKSRSKDWLPTTANEMKKFVGIMICMGLVQLPHINLYWSKNPLYGNPLIKQTMPRDRFLLLKKFWHFANNLDAQVQDDRLGKINTIVEYLNSAFMDALTPGKDLVIDETMIPWRGRLIFRQYIKNKSHKYGVKVYKLCTVDGYTLRTVLYAGKGQQTRESNKGHTYDVVMELMGPFDQQNVHFDGFLNEGRSLTTDNFYTGIPIAEELLKHKTRLCGTINVNRKGLPKDLGKTTLKKGESKGFKCQHGTKVMKWKDKRVVTMISTEVHHDSKLINTGKRNRKNEAIMKPRCVLDYNSVKKGVDYSDQMSSYYTTLRKSLKWYKKVALELLTGTTLVNSWVVYEKLTNTKMPMLKFRELIARSLMGVDVPQRQTLTPPSKKRPHALGKSEGEGKKKRRRCKGCYEKIRRSSSSREADRKTKTVNTFCKDCPGQPFYCLTCFSEKHT
jgi:hypothetical protein